MRNTTLVSGQTRITPEFLAHDLVRAIPLCQIPNSQRAWSLSRAKWPVWVLQQFVPLRLSLGVPSTSGLYIIGEGRHNS